MSLLSVSFGSLPLLELGLGLACFLLSLAGFPRRRFLPSSSCFQCAQSNCFQLLSHVYVLQSFSSCFFSSRFFCKSFFLSSCCFYFSARSILFFFLSVLLPLSLFFPYIKIFIHVPLFRLICRVNRRSGNNISQTFGHQTSCHKRVLNFSFDVYPSPLEGDEKSGGVICSEQ